MVKTVLNQPALHQHLFYCLESDSATLFPTLSHPTNDAGSSLLDKYFTTHIGKTTKLKRDKRNRLVQDQHTNTSIRSKKLNHMKHKESVSESRLQEIQKRQKLRCNRAYKGKYSEEYF